MARAKHESARADVSCAVCGKRLELWDAVKGLDGRTVCASGCMGGFLAGLPDEERAPPTEETPGPPPGGWFDW